MLLLRLCRIASMRRAMDLIRRCWDQLCIAYHFNHVEVSSFYCPWLWSFRSSDRMTKALQVILTGRSEPKFRFAYILHLAHISLILPILYKHVVHLYDGVLLIRRCIKQKCCIKQPMNCFATSHVAGSKQVRRMLDDVRVPLYGEPWMRCLSGSAMTLSYIILGPAPGLSGWTQSAEYNIWNSKDKWTYCSTIVVVVSIAGSEQVVDVLYDLCARFD